MVRLENTQYWLLKNSRGQYICEGGKLKQAFHRALPFDTKKIALEYRDKNRKRSFNPVEIIGITFIDNSQHPKTVVTSEQIEVKHKAN